MTTLNLRKMICAIEDKDKPKVYSSDLEALMDSHLWDKVKIHLTRDAIWRLGSAFDREPRDLNEQEKQYLEEQVEEDYHNDGYDKWDEDYHDDDGYDSWNEKHYHDDGYDRWDESYNDGHLYDGVYNDYD